MDCFDVKITDGAISSVSSLALAHVGDGVFDLMVRAMLVEQGAETADKLHKRTIKIVSAKAQAVYAEKILPSLTDKELAVFKRGRNAKVSGIPRAASEGEYHTATALEALLGWLFLKGERERIRELFDIMMEEHDAP